ncbi:unnamed protein product [Urochloa humidicola]
MPPKPTPQLFRYVSKPCKAAAPPAAPEATSSAAAHDAPAAFDDDADGVYRAVTSMRHAVGDRVRARGLRYPAHGAAPGRRHAPLPASRTGTRSARSRSSSSLPTVVGSCRCPSPSTPCSICSAGPVGLCT